MPFVRMAESAAQPPAAALAPIAHRVDHCCFGILIQKQPIAQQSDSSAADTGTDCHANTPVTTIAGKSASAMRLVRVSGDSFDIDYLLFADTD